MSRWQDAAAKAGIKTAFFRGTGGKSPDPISIRSEINKRFSIEDVNLPPDNLKIAQSKNGYSVRIQTEKRVPYIADVWLLIVFDKQVEIRR